MLCNVMFNMPDISSLNEMHVVRGREPQLKPILQNKTCGPQQVTVFSESILPMLICDMRPLTITFVPGFNN